MSVPVNQSQFPQLPSAAQTQMLWGRFAAGATAPTSTSSGGFTVSKVATGEYTITFSKAFADAGYSLVVMPQTTAGGTAASYGVTASASSIQVNLTSAGALADIAWTFIAIGIY